MSPRWLIWFGLAALGGGCATVTPFRGIAVDGGSVYVAGLPPIRQDKRYACGAACLAAVAAYWNVPLAQFQAHRAQMPEDATGRDLQLLAEDLGLRAFAYQSSMDDLRDNLQKGRPLIVMIPQPVLPPGDLIGSTLCNAWNQWGHKPAHWVVVVGLTQNQRVILHDPASGSVEVKQEAFSSWWAEKNHLAVLVAAP